MQFGRHLLDLQQVQVMGILNVTPDSFSDGGQHYRDSSLVLDHALRHAERMIKDGASIIDIGGESTRPGAAAVGEQEELDRVVPVVESIAKRFEVVISVDTSTAEVITESAKVGAGLINDVRALQRPGAISAAASTGLPVCIMHMQGEPQTMQQKPQYSQVLEEVIAFLDTRVEACVAAGIPKEQIILDPGFGFGKRIEDNIELLRELDKLVAHGYPVLSGTSRKSMLGAICERDVGDRLAGSLATALIAAQKGARILRVHDVAQTVDIVRIFNALA